MACALVRATTTATGSPTNRTRPMASSGRANTSGLSSTGGMRSPPMSPAVNTPTTPGIARASSASADRTSAWAIGDRTNTPCSAPSQGTSSVYWAAPVSSARSSLRSTGRPSTRSGAGASSRSGAWAVMPASAVRSAVVADALRHERPVGLDQVVAHRYDLPRRQRGRRVRVDQRGLVDQAAPLFQHRAHGEFHHVEKGPVQGEALRGEGPDPRGLDTVLVDQGRHLHAGVAGKPVDQPAVPHVRVDLTGGAGLERVDDLGSQLGGGLDLQLLAGVQGRLRLLPVLEVPLAAAHVLVDLAPELLDLVVEVEEPGDVLARVLAGLSGEVAEAPEDLHAHPPAQPLRIGLVHLPEPRVQVLAVATVAEPQHEALMIEASGAEGDVRLGHANGGGQEGMGVPHRVAHADHVRERGALVDGPRHHGHRVGVVQQQGVRRQFVEVVADTHRDGDGAEPAEDAADPDRVADRLADPVLLRDLEVHEGMPVPPDLDLVDDVVRAVHGGPAFRAGLHPVPGARPPHDRRGGALGVREALRVDVVQDDGDLPGQLRERAQVGDYVAGELHAASADDCDSGHERECSMYRLSEQVRANQFAYPPVLAPASRVR